MVLLPQLFLHPCRQHFDRPPHLHGLVLEILPLLQHLPLVLFCLFHGHLHHPSSFLQIRILLLQVSTLVLHELLCPLYLILIDQLRVFVLDLAHLGRFEFLRFQQHLV